MMRLLRKNISRDLFKLQPLKKSFSCAISGIVYLFFSHRNMRVIFIMGILAVCLGVFLGLSSIEFVILFVTISVVFLAEMFNTAIELVIDTFTDKYHVLAKVIKDISAGVVLIACGNAVVIGYFLFWKKIVLLIK